LLLHTSSSHSLTPSPPPSPLYTLSLHDALPISPPPAPGRSGSCRQNGVSFPVSLTFTQAAPDTPPMSARGHRFGLLLSVTLAGMAVLIIEITAIRMLAPYFGNSIFTISSVIGIILAALGVGYYLGGTLADRKPSAAWFFSLIVIAGFSVLLLQFLNAVLLPGIAYKLSLIDGPLIVSFLMFFLPALFLAMLSPFAITLLHEIGRASCRV